MLRNFTKLQYAKVFFLQYAKELYKISICKGTSQNYNMLRNFTKLQYAKELYKIKIRKGIFKSVWVTFLSLIHPVVTIVEETGILVP